MPRAARRDARRRHGVRGPRPRDAVRRELAGFCDDAGRYSLRDARIVNLPGAGHYVFITKEAEVIREIGAFLAVLR